MKRKLLIALLLTLCLPCAGCASTLKALRENYVTSARLSISHGETEAALQLNFERQTGKRVVPSK